MIVHYGEQSSDWQEVSGMEKTSNSDNIRHHSDAAVEGATEGWVSHDTGLHSQDPAEGPDIDDSPSSGSGT
jgi:hypothetical protein